MEISSQVLDEVFERAPDYWERVLPWFGEDEIEAIKILVANGDVQYKYVSHQTEHGYLFRAEYWRRRPSNLVRQRAAWRVAAPSQSRTETTTKAPP
jgi:hypothetical protein